MDQGERRGRIDHIQVLRGVAATLVLIAHSVDVSVRQGSWFGDAWLPLGNFGAFGVDIFFVISGFVMPYSLEGKRGADAARRFLLLRWIRIAPPYLIIVAALCILWWYQGVPATWRSIANAVLFLPFFDGSEFTEPPLAIGWTLSFEFTFYLVVAAIVALSVRRRDLAIISTLVTLAVLGLVAPPTPYILQWVTNPMLLEFALGATVYVLWREGLVHRFRAVWWSLGLAAVAVLILQNVIGFGSLSEAGTVYSSVGAWWRVLAWGVPAALLFLAVIALPAGREGTAYRLAMGLGNASYSVYLVHLPVIGLAGTYLFRIGAPAPVVFASCIAIGIVAGIVYFRLVEKPLTSLLRRKAVDAKSPQRAI